MEHFHILRSLSPVEDAHFLAAVPASWVFFAVLTAGADARADVSSGRSVGYWGRTWSALAPIALVAALVLWLANFTLSSYFYLDDYIYLRDAQRDGLSLRYLFEKFPFGDHLSPGVRLASWVTQRFFQLNFTVAQALLLVGFAGSLLLLWKILIELQASPRVSLLLTFFYGTSVVHVAVTMWWAAGVHRIPPTLLSLACMLAYLRFWRTGSRRLLMLSLVALVVALLFYVKALLVPFYLLLLRALVLDGERPLRESIASLRREWRLWAVYLAPIGVYLAIYVSGYLQPIPLPSLGVVGTYLRLSWASAFAPGFLGIPTATTPPGPAPSTVVAVQVTFVALLVWTVLRSPRAWRAWAFFAAVFLANTLLVGLPLLQGLGAEIAYRPTYYVEPTYLLPISLAVAFGAGSAVQRRSPGAAAAWWQRPAVSTLGLVAVAAIHAPGAWQSGQRVSEGSGRQAGTYMRNVKRDILEARRSGVTPAIVDGTVPEHVVSSYLLWGAPRANRYSEVFTLVDPDLTFSRPAPMVFDVAPDGTFHRKAFVAVGGGELRSLRHRSGRCAPLQLSSDPVEVAFGRALPTDDWHLDVRYSATEPGEAIVSVDDGSGYDLSHGVSVPLDASENGAALVRLGRSQPQRLRLSLLSGSSACFRTVTAGLLVADVSDSFSRPDSDFWLGRVPGGGPWRARAGRWGIAGGEAQVAAPGGGRDHAVVDLGLGHAPAKIGVRVAKVADGAGLVFRYRDPANYWAVVAVPGYGTWGVIRVMDGREQVIADTGASGVADGTMVGVSVGRQSFDVLLDGRVSRTISDSSLGDAGLAGMTARGGPGKAAFDDFSFVPAAPCSPAPRGASCVGEPNSPSFADDSSSAPARRVP